MLISLTTWEMAQNGDLVGTIEMPMPVGLVGGATKTHPLARLALKIMDVKSAQELGEIAVAVGLAQNMGALRALATEGIQRGHMTLHARNIALGAGATGDDVDWVVKQMISSADFRTDFALEVLQRPRELHDISARSTILPGPQSKVLAKRDGALPAPAIPLYWRAANIAPIVSAQTCADSQPGGVLSRYMTELHCCV